MILRKVQFWTKKKQLWTKKVRVWTIKKREIGQLFEGKNRQKRQKKTTSHYKAVWWGKVIINQEFTCLKTFIQGS
jgi:hypothetical protein